MSHQKDQLNKRTSSKKQLPSLKKLPVKKAASSQAKKIIVDVQPRKDYSSLVDLLLRKVADAPRTKMPSDLKPMLATLVDEPFSDDQWQFELKLDGYRALAYLKGGKADIRSRNNNTFNKKISDIQHALAEWNINAVI